MSNTENDTEDFFSDEEWAEITESWETFNACDHAWVREPVDSIFEYICKNCGGAQGLRPMEDI